MIVDAIFEACQSDVASPFLVPEDVQRKGCITAVDQIVGGSNGSIDNLFKVADSNGDGIVMRSEVSDAFKALTLQRSSSSPTCETEKRRICNPISGCSHMTVFKCNGKRNCNAHICRDCKCP